MEPLSNSVKDKMLRAEVENSNLQTSTSRYLHKMMQNMPSVQEDQVEVEQNDVVAISELLDFVNQNIETLFVEFSKNEELHKLEQTIRAKSTYPDLLAAIDSYNGHFPVKKPTATGSLGANGATIVPMDDQDEDSRQKAMSGAQSFARELTNLYLHVKNLYDHDTKIVDLEHSTRVESGPMQIYSFFPDTLLDFIGQNTHLFNKNIDPNNIKEEDVPCVHFKGCCMLADISGFSKFSGEMCAQGLSGLDKLTEVTNGFLGDYVKIVYQYRGDVIAFAGDALICLFREEPDLYESSTLSPNCCTRALQCSKVLQHLKTDRLSTHLAISFGEMKIALLGGVDDKWAYIMNGGCIAEIGAAVDYAKAEETACTQACFEHSEKGRKAAMTGEFASLVREDKEEFKLTFEKVGPPSETFQIYKLKDVTDCQELKQFSRRKSVQLTSSRIGVFKKASRTLEIVARFIPSPVLAAVCNDSLGDISELRQVTTIFLSLDSYDPIKHQDPRSLQPFFTISQQLLLETGGFLRQFLVDDKGCVLIAMWGVPSVSYSNNTVRAVYFAVNLRKRAEKEIGLMCSIGVTTGSVFCGWVGSTTRRDYAGVGTQVNVAARLMCKAKGRVLIDPDSYRNLDPMTKAQCTAAESLVLKGIAYPVIPHYFNLDLEPSMSNVKKPAITGALYTLKASIKKIIEKDILQFSRAPPTKDSFEKNFDKPKSKLQHKPAARSRKERQLLIVVAGPSGSGKGMVAGHFKDGLEKKKLVVISLKCRSTQKSHQYGLVKELLMEIIGHEKFAKDSTGGKDVIHELVQGACQYFTEDEKEHSRSRLRFILDVEVDGEDLSIHRKPNPTDDIIPRMLSYLLRNNAQTAIVIEDAHSCDEVSWNELYNILLKKEISIMILITVKSIDQEKVLSSIVQMCMSDFESPTVKLATDGLASAEKKSNAYNKKVSVACTFILV
jgi:class 3 adenylate cyclase